VGDISALKWPRAVVEDALNDAGYDPGNDAHYWVIRNMGQFQRRTESARECASWAVAKAENTHEQKQRRVSHGTGAE
jgi:hypothetical protein